MLRNARGSYGDKKTFGGCFYLYLGQERVCVELRDKPVPLRGGGLYASFFDEKEKGIFQCPSERRGGVFCFKAGKEVLGDFSYGVKTFARAFAKRTSSIREAALLFNRGSAPEAERVFYAGIFSTVRAAGHVWNLSFLPQDVNLRQRPVLLKNAKIFQKACYNQAVRRFLSEEVPYPYLSCRT